MQYKGLLISTTIAAGLTLFPAWAAQAAELEAATGQGNLVVATQGEVATFTVELHATGKISCGAHANHAAVASIETSYAIVDGAISEGGRPSQPQRFFRAETAQPPPSGGCPVTWDTSPVPYRIQASVGVSPGTPPADYPVVLKTTALGGSGSLADDHPTTITVRVLEREEAAGPPPPEPSVVAPTTPPPSGGLPRPRENVSVNLVPVRGRVLVRYPGSPRLVLLEEAVQVPVRSRLDTTAGTVQLVSDNDARGTPQSATFWNGRFTVAYTRTVVAGPRGQTRRPRRRASRPITELTLANACGGRHARPASASRAKPRRRRGLFGRGRGRFRTRGSHGAGTVRGTHWYTENRCRSTFFRVMSGVVDVRDFSKGRTVKLRRKKSYLARSARPTRG